MKALGTPCSDCFEKSGWVRQSKWLIKKCHWLRPEDRIDLTRRDLQSLSVASCVKHPSVSQASPCAIDMGFRMKHNTGIKS